MFGLSAGCAAQTPERRGGRGVVQEELPKVRVDNERIRREIQKLKDEMERFRKQEEKLMRKKPELVPSLVLNVCRCPSASGPSRRFAQQHRRRRTLSG